MMQIFKFDTLITPSIIKFIFYVGVLFSLLGALASIVSALGMMQYNVILGLGYLVGGLLLAVVGVVISRVAAEMTLVLFMIRDELAWQRQDRQAGMSK